MFPVDTHRVLGQKLLRVRGAFQVSQRLVHVPEHPIFLLDRPPDHVVEHAASEASIHVHGPTFRAEDGGTRDGKLDFVREFVEFLPNMAFR